eukprot:CAMPEP_0178985348 /NCGR_PEP_ID=MMETSP0795-20121207/2098_1 /TAXON_ID=88552 /ORGANISM="Amoebophrya sp., Strain Ameob2" /LENGTH=529 /DNA_ID=CAMNT_0020676287 /DNA_START=51 /DNA_END=1640 /DNA_ORIENTATION=-
MSKNKVQDPLLLRLQGLEEIYGAAAVDAARIALGIPQEELFSKDGFENKYDAEFTSASQFRKDFLPDDRSPRLKQRKKEMWEFKRELHLEAIENALTGHRNAPMPKLREKSQKLYLRAHAQLGQSGDGGMSQPPLPDLSEFERDMEIRNQQIKEDFERRQVKKATMLIEALVEKEQVALHAEAKMQESTARFLAYKKALKEGQKERSKAISEKMGACLAAAAATHKQHLAHAQEVFAHLNARLDRAQTFRDDKLDPTALKANADKSLQMTKHRLETAKKKMMDTCDELKARQDAADRKLAEQKAQIAAEIEATIEASKRKFAKITQDVADTMAAQLKERLEKHENFENHYAVVASNRKQFLKDRSDTVKQKMGERFSLMTSNKGSLQSNTKEKHEAMAQRSKHMDERVSYVKDLRLKNGMDVYTHKEQKYETFGALQQRNFAAKQRAWEMRKTCSLLKVAETRQKAEAKQAQFDRAMDIKNKMFRDLSSKEERLNGTRDPNKLAAIMTEMGFKVPDVLKPGKKKEKKSE